MRRLIKSIACALVLLCLSAPVQAGFETVSLQTATSPAEITGLKYNVYAGGMHALNAKLLLDIDHGAYDLGLTAETKGFIGKVFPWRGDYTTSGKAENGTLVPSLHTASQSWRDKIKTTEMLFNPDGKVLKTTTQVGNKAKVDRDIRPDLAADAVDMLTGAILLFQNNAINEKCEGATPVFDGKRRFSITLKDAGMDTIRKSRYSAYHGEAIKCIIKVEPLAGFKRRDNKRGWMLIQNHTEKRNKPPTLWLARLQEGGPMVPVRMEIASDYGAVVAHLTGTE